jgi:hypothetical protein
MPSLIERILGQTGSDVPCYEPPYDSPIEDTFAWNLVKYVSPSAQLTPQVDVRTERGLFRLDFVLSKSRYRVGFECDGKEFHDAERDEWRDAVVLGERHIDVMYRLQGHDIHYNVEACLYLISHWERALFRDDARINLKQLTFSPDVRQHEMMPRERTRELVCEGVSEDHQHGPGNGCSSMDLIRRVKGQWWMNKLYDESLVLGPGDLDSIIERYRKKPKPEIPSI